MKHRGFSKMISWILTAIMILTALPLSSIPSRAESVDTEEKEAQTIRTEESDVKESMLSDFRGNTEENVSGVCGDLTWTLNNEGILTFSGEGYMGSTFSWEEYKDRIQTVLIEDGVKSITSDAFSGYPNICRISIGKDVVSIGPGAFKNCPYLEEILFNATNLNDQEAETYSFYNSGTSGSGITLTVGDEVESFPSELCSSIKSLKNVTFGKKVGTIGKGAFWSCTGLTNITFGESISSIGIDAFYNCRGLKTITFLGDKPLFRSNCFGNVTCDGYYPYGNTTWTPLPSLGSSVHITWIPFGITSLSTITFDANGGQGQMESFYFPTSERNDNTFLPRNSFTRNNYAFLGWNTKADGTGVFCLDGARVNPTDQWIEQWNEEEGSYILTEDSLTLYAQWTDRAQISFDANGGEGVMDKMVVFFYENNDNTFLPQNAFTREGYSFRGWNTKADGTGWGCPDESRVNPTENWIDHYDDGSGYIIVNQSITLYAQWTENAQISFDANGGEGEMESIWVSIERDDNTFLPQNAFTREGYSFRGWNTKADGTGKFCKDGARVNPTEDWIDYYGGDSDDGYIIVNQSITLYAQWIKDEIVIHFDPNGGVGEMEDFIVPKTFNWETLPYHTFSRGKHDFIGWNTKPDGTGEGYRDEVYVGRSVKELNEENGISAGDFICVTDDVTLYAQWEEYDAFTISFDPNGGEGQMEEVYVRVVNRWLYLPSCTFFREGHKFTGWNTKADGTGNSYSDSDYLWYDYDEDITLYAQWRQAGGPQVICSKSSDGKYTLSFVNSPIDYFEESEYNGESILQVWTGTKVTNSGEGENYDYYRYEKNEPAWVNSGYLFNRFVIDESFINVLPTCTAYWFVGVWDALSNQEIIGLEYLNTSATTDMSNMFYGCGVSELDLRSLITTNVTTMSRMFCGCQASNLDLSTFDTSNVTDMSRMFVACSRLTSLDLSAFDTSNVTDMSNMFASCSVLTSLDLSTFDTSNVTDMSGMFASCSALTSLDISTFNTSSVTNMANMFSRCLGLTRLNLRGIDTSNVTDMSYMFGTYMDPGIANTSMKIKELDLSDLDTSSVTNMSGMFSGCNELTALDLSHFNTSQVQTMEKMFYSCLRLETLDLSSFDMRNVTNADAMFGECKRLKTIFCMDGESAWPDDSYSQYSQGILFGSNTNLVGRYGTTEVPFNAGYADAEMARSAKLGGYFTPKYVTVGFDANGGTGELEGFRTYSGFYDAEGIVLPGNVFAKECGLFAGWNTRADGSGDFYEDCSAFAPLEDVILYAQWDDDHDWEEAAYVWANDYKTVTATRVCGKNNDHQFTETVSVTKTVVEPTCESEGYTLLTASFESDLFETQTKKVDEKPASGHRYGEAFYHWAYDNTHVIAMLICEIDNTHVLTEVAEVTATIVEPTCESEGYTLLKAVFENEAFEPQTRIIDNVPPHGHQYGAPTYQWTDDNSLVIARAACGFDNAHVLMEISETSLVIKANDCENSGERIYTASFENEIFETQTKVIVMPALGHKPGEPVKENEKAATCTEEGSYDEVVYCTVCGEELSRTHETVAALGHDWSEADWTWSEDYTEASATFTCGHDCTHVETVEAEVTRETDEENGLIIYTATVVFEGKTYTDTKEQEIPKEPWTWTRLSGSNRYATMASINQAAFADGSMRTLIVATGESFPDALSGASLSGIYGCPIILTKSDALRKETKAEIERLASPEGCRVIILGGTGAVSQAVEDAIIAMGYSVERVAGTNRVKTAIEVYRKGVSEDAAFAANDTVIISTGYNYADVLSISPYAYASKTPILLTNQKGELSAEVKSLIKEAGFRKAIIVGGIGAVAESTEDYLKMQGLSVLRLAGKTRYATSGTIMKWEIGLLSDEAIQPAVIMTNAGMGVASGENFPDALASVSLLGQSRSVLMLVSNTKSRATIQDNINELIKPYAREMKKGYIFGGTGAVSEEIEQLLNESIE